MVRPLFLLGPTASGKTAVALELARRLEGEIVGLDSMQIYRGLPVLTAVPTPAERAAVPHHLVEEVELTERVDANRYAGWVKERVAAIAARGRRPIVCGGSGLYFSALVDGLSALPPADRAVRAELEARAAAEGPSWLHTELARLDPPSATRLHPNDAHRLIRALEVCRLTGRPYSEQLGRKQSMPPESYDAFGLEVPKDELRRRIASRAEHMLAEGALTEVAWAAGVLGAAAGSGFAGAQRPGTARQLLGFSQILPHLAGEIDRAEALRRLIRDTRLFARRQLSWFRRNPAIRWVAAPDGTSPASVADSISSRF